MGIGDQTTYASMYAYRFGPGNQTTHASMYAYRFGPANQTTYAMLTDLAQIDCGFLLSIELLITLTIILLTARCCHKTIVFPLEKNSILKNAQYSAFCMHSYCGKDLETTVAGTYVVLLLSSHFLPILILFVLLPCCVLK